MNAVPRARIIRGTAILTMGDGSQWTTEITHTTVDQWRDTPFGRMNAGFVIMSSPRLVKVVGEE